jgi:hypothetical protein
VVAGAGRLPGSEPLLEQFLALVGPLAALALGAPEEVGQLDVAVALGVLDVGVQPERV